MQYDLLKDATPIMALIAILSSALGFMLKKFSDNMTSNRIATEKAISDNQLFVKDVIEKYEKREEKLLNHFDKIDESQMKISTTLYDLNREMKDIKDELKEIKVNRR